MGLFDKIKDKAKDLTSAESIEKYKNKAKDLAETTKTKIHEATAPPPPPELTARQSELVQKFGYTVKGGEKILFASETEDFMVTNSTFLIAQNGKYETAVYNKAYAMSLYFAKGWRYVRIGLRNSGGTPQVFDGLELPADDIKAFCRAWVDAFIHTNQDVVQDDMAFMLNAGQWLFCTAQANKENLLESFEESCGFKLSPGEEIIYMGRGTEEFMFTNKNLLINFDYHPSYSRDKYFVMGHENCELTIQIEPCWKMLHIIPEGFGIVDKLNLYPSDAKDFIAAFCEFQGVYHYPEWFENLNIGQAAVELIISKDRSHIGGKEIGTEGRSENEQIFTHPDAEAFHEMMNPASGIVFAYWEADRYYYPAEAGKPNESGLIEVAFMDGQSAVLNSRQCVKFGEAVENMKFQANWQNGGAYYPCSITAISDDFTEVAVHYEDGADEQINISQLRAIY